MATRFVTVPALMAAGEGVNPNIGTMIDQVREAAAAAGEHLNGLLNDGFNLIGQESVTHVENGVVQAIVILILFKPDPLPIRKPGTSLSSLEASAINVEAFMRD